MLVDRGHPRHLGTVHNLAVRLIRDEHNRILGIALSVGLAQNIGQSRQRVACIYGTGRIVGRVNDDGRRLIADRLEHVVHAQLERIFIGERLNTRTAGLLNPNAILRKVRGDNNNLVARIRNGVERAGERSRGTHRHKDVFALIARAKAAVERFGHSGTTLRQARCGRVAVQLVARQLQGLLNRLSHSSGRRNARIAQRKIEYVFRTDLRLALKAIAKNLTDDGAFRTASIHSFVDHLFPFRIGAIVRFSRAKCRSNVDWGQT